MNANVDAFLLQMEAQYSRLFSVFRKAGWSDTYHPIPDAVTSSPRFATPFPLHDAALGLLQRFSGLVVELGTGWVNWGCSDLMDAYTLRVIRPYDIERHLLREPAVGQRPPLVPIWAWHDIVLFMRDDWTCVSTTDTLSWVTIDSNPFEDLHRQLVNDQSAYEDRSRTWPIEHHDSLPPHLRQIHL